MHASLRCSRFAGLTLLVPFVAAAAAFAAGENAVNGASNPPAAVVATIAVDQPGRAIPADFLGISYEGRQLLPDKTGGHYFSPDNARLIALFRTIGIKSLRVGGNSSELPDVNPTDADRAALFQFARAAGVSVIFNLRLKTSAGEKPDPDNLPGQVRIADTLLREYADMLQAFEVSNEPDHDSIVQWPVYQKLADELIAGIERTPNGAKARFLGPSTTSGAAVNTFPAKFAETYAKRGNVILATQHWYPGGNQQKVTDLARKRAEMVEIEKMHGRYLAFYNKFVPAVQAAGMKYRLEETNSLSIGGRPDVSDTYAMALWALDYLYWWAAHDAEGMNFHSGQMSYTAIMPAAGGYATRPLGYAMKAFDLGGHGRLLPVKLDSAQPDVGAYATLADDGSVAVTIVNGTHDKSAAAKTVTLAMSGKAFGRARAWTLVAADHSLAAKHGIALGGVGIAEDGTWSGQPTALAASPDGRFTVEVPAAAAVVVRLE